MAKQAGIAASEIDERTPGVIVKKTAELTTPYTVEMEVTGVAQILFHRWDCDEVAARSAAAKGSRRKKEDNVESYVYRCPDGSLGVPARNVKAMLVAAAKYVQDPRSPRKSAQDIFRAGVLVRPEIISLGLKEYEFTHRCRAQIQRNSVTRVRPGVEKGWKLRFDVDVLLPGYITPELLYEVLAQAGYVVGLCDYRPEFGRFQVTRFEQVKLEGGRRFENGATV